MLGKTGKRSVRSSWRCDCLSVVEHIVHEAKPELSGLAQMPMIFVSITIRCATNRLEGALQMAPSWGIGAKQMVAI